MHWLPLVAMVIASALPFPHSPVTSTVAAMTEPGSSLDDHTEDIDDSSSHSPGSYATLPAPQAYNVDYKDYNNPSIIKEEVQTLKGKRKQQSYLSKSNFHTENTNSVGLNKYSNTDGGKLRSTNGSSHQDYPSQENYVLGDYKPDSSRAGDDSSFRDMAQKENHHHSLDPRTDEQETYKPSTNAGHHSKTGPDPSSQRTLQRAEHPPLLLMLESGMLPIEGEDKEEEEDVSDADGHMEGHGDRETDGSVPLSWVDTLRGAREPPHPAPRHKRSHLPHTGRGEMPVCESESVWVTDKTTVFDDRGKTVNIVPEIKTVKGALKQYFYETRCRQEGQQRGGGPQREAGGAGASAAGTGTGPVGVSGASCRGVDIRQWVSQCKAKDTYVRALTVDNNGLQGWRWVRINSSCVCVLLSRVTRKNRGRE
uniref:Neurotrophin-4 n=1 Tax=Oncorhynchus tshawytscha TaxID=74940 RepID=A0AAZ3RBY1_ONCTS